MEVVCSTSDGITSVCSDTSNFSSGVSLLGDCATIQSSSIFAPAVSEVLIVCDTVSSKVGVAYCSYEE